MSRCRTKGHHRQRGTTETFAFDDGAPHTNRVGAYRASKWGLFDMTGNVREWCHDYGGAYPALLIENPRGPERGIARTIRRRFLALFARRLPRRRPPTKPRNLLLRRPRLPRRA